MEIKQWGDFFKLNESKTDEPHDDTEENSVEYQCKYICDNIKDVDDDLMEKIYKLIKKDK